MHLNHHTRLRASQPVAPRWFMLPVLLMFFGLAGLLGLAATEPALGAVDAPARIALPIDRGVVGSVAPAPQPLDAVA